ncbi:MAG: hypothetical protein R2939_23145, partial [Kofleriaceae bacterium]
FLAPMPLSLLAIPGEVQHMLATLGVRTLGQFAALPPPTAARAWDADYQALARGDAGAILHVDAAATPLVERAVLGEGSFGLGAAVAVLAERVATRLPGRRGVDGMTVTWEQAHGAGGHAEVECTDDPAELADRLSHAVAGATDVVALTATVHDEPAAVEVARVARGSGPIATAAALAEAEPDDEPFRLTPTPMTTVVSRMPHRRTRRGKQRTRASVVAQARLFGTGD